MRSVSEQKEKASISIFGFSALSPPSTSCDVREMGRKGKDRK
jgi:hypothetical protein